jgi:hypothetical protein
MIFIVKNGTNLDCMALYRLSTSTIYTTLIVLKANSASLSIERVEQYNDEL